VFFLYKQFSSCYDLPVKFKTTFPSSSKPRFAWKKIQQGNLRLFFKKPSQPIREIIPNAIEDKRINSDKTIWGDLDI